MQIVLESHLFQYKLTESHLLLETVILHPQQPADKKKEGKPFNR